MLSLEREKWDLNCVGFPQRFLCSLSLVVKVSQITESRDGIVAWNNTCWSQVVLNIYNLWFMVNG